MLLCITCYLLTLKKSFNFLIENAKKHLQKEIWNRAYEFLIWKVTKKILIGSFIIQIYHLSI